MLGDRYPRPLDADTITGASIPDGAITSSSLRQNAPESITAARRTTIVESVAMGAGILVIGASYVFSVISPAGLAVATGTVLTLAGVMMVVAAWTAERGERHARLIAMVLDRHERDRTAEYGAIMRKISFVEGHADNLIGQTMQRIEDVGTRLESMRAAYETGWEIFDKELQNGLSSVEQMVAACDAAEARRNVEHHAALDKLSETFASELLAINGAMGGLRAAVDDALTSRTVADEIYKTAADLGVHPANFLIHYKAEALRPSSDDPIADLIAYKVQSGDLPRTCQGSTREAVEHLPYCAAIDTRPKFQGACTCRNKPSEAEGE